MGSGAVRTRSEVRGPRSELGDCGGDVALMVALLSCHEALPEHVPLSSCRSGKQVRAWGCGQGLRALREVVKKSVRNPKEHALHSLRTRSASTFAARGDGSYRVIQREGTWKFDSYKAYTRNNADDAGHASLKLAAGKGLQRRPGQDIVWGNCRSPRLTSDVEE